MEYTLLESFAVTPAPTEWSDPELFILFYLDKGGRELYYEECGTIDYSVERARSVAGVDEGEWRECQFELPADFDRIDLPDIR